MKKRFLVILLALCFYPFAAGANLAISTFYVLFDAGSAKRTEVVRVTNNSNSQKVYRISLINFKQNADGTYSEIEQPLPGNPFASPYIGFSPHETSLVPGQTQTIRLVRRPMAAAADGEYVSHLLVRELPEKNKKEQTSNSGELKIDIKALYGVTIPVIIDKGNLHSSAAISSASVNNKAEKPYASVNVKRNGTRSFWGNLIVKQGKKEIGRVNGFKIFMTTPDRQIKIPLSEKIVSGGQVILEDARTNETISSKNL